MSVYDTCIHEDCRKEIRYTPSTGWMHVDTNKRPCYPTVTNPYEITKYYQVAKPYGKNQIPENSTISMDPEEIQVLENSENKFNSKEIQIGENPMPKSNERKFQLPNDSKVLFNPEWILITDGDGDQVQLGAETVEALVALIKERIETQVRFNVE